MRLALWPSIEVNELLNFILNYPPESIYKDKISFVIVESALELMLEKLISTMLIPDLIPEPTQISIIEETIIDGYQGRNRMLMLYNRLGYGNFTSNVKKCIGKKEFMKNWDYISKERNKFVHGKLLDNKVPNEIINFDIDMFINDALEVFYLLNNDFASEWLKRN